MIVVSWNCRGLGHPSKINFLKDLIKSKKPDILLIQDTKLSSQEMEGIIGKSRIYEGLAISTMGASGGISTIWEKMKWKLQQHTRKDHWINTKLENIETGGTKSIYNIYSTNHYKDKETCWETLKESIGDDREDNILVGGDLNLILKAKEKRGGNFLLDQNRETLEEIMEQSNLLDIPPKNGKYTWDNRRIGKANIKEILDRILI